MIFQSVFIYDPILCFGIVSSLAVCSVVFILSVHNLVLTLQGKWRHSLIGTFKIKIISN